MRILVLMGGLIRQHDQRPGTPRDDHSYLFVLRRRWVKGPSKSAAIPVRRSMPYWKNYHRADTIDDALEVLASAPGPARSLAGGTDLLLDLQQGRHAPVHTLVDITSIPELNALELRPDGLFLGAAVPLSRLVASPLVQRHAEALQEACNLIGGPQVRNTATLGGNVAHALPAGDGTIALMALDAVAEVAALPGVRREPVDRLFHGPGVSALDLSCELIVGFYLPRILPGQASSFVRIMRPQGVALPILNMAGRISRGGDLVREIRLALGPAGPTPQRARKTEEYLRGSSLGPDRIEGALGILMAEVNFRTSPYRASATYRRELVGVLLHEVLETAWSRAGRA